MRGESEVNDERESLAVMVGGGSESARLIPSKLWGNRGRFQG